MNEGDCAINSGVSFIGNVRQARLGTFVGEGATLRNAVTGMCEKWLYIICDIVLPAYYYKKCNASIG